MALPNGVLVHGPTSWGVRRAAAGRDDQGRRGEEARLRRRASRIRSCAARLKLAGGVRAAPAGEARDCPRRKLPFERPGVIAAMAASAVAVRAVRTSAELRPLARELASGLLSLAPALARAARRRARRLPRRRARLDRDLRARRAARRRSTSAAARTSSGRCSRRRRSATRSPSRAPAQLRGPARAAASVGAVGGVDELFGWMTRHPDTTLARALAAARARAPAPASRRRSRAPEQLEVAQAALDACLSSRSTATAAPAETRTRLPPEMFDAPRREDARGVLHRRVLQPHARRAARRRPAPAGLMQVFQKQARVARRHGRGDRDPQALPRTTGRR